jgi:hypothetical protein
VLKGAVLGRKLSGRFGSGDVDSGDSRCCRREDIFQGTSGGGLGPGVKKGGLGFLGVFS